MGQALDRAGRDQLPVTSYALLGLLTFGDELTGYELKQRADRTLRFYWVSPAMSQVYSELGRLTELGLVARNEEDRGTRYGITPAGRDALKDWMTGTAAGFPVLKHPVALRLLLGHVVDPETTIAMLRDHLDALDAERAALLDVRTSLKGADGPGEPFRYPSIVADWGLDYFDHERRIIEDLVQRLESRS
jgi:DNA-binding PadR family transcriptional regulator